MKVTKDLLKRFFSNQCTAEEANDVAEFLQQHPEVGDQFYNEQDWEANSELSLFSEIQQQQVKDQIWLQLGILEKKRSYKQWFIAAAMLLLIAATALWFQKSPVEAVKDEVVHNLIKINYDNEDLSFLAADGSMILLKPGSEISYPERFVGSTRSFNLKGEARFKVAKDVKRPFSVHAGGTVTTALGTDFTVKTLKYNQHTKIVLHEGKVVVRPEQGAVVSKTKAIYLIAGQQITVNSQSFQMVSESVKSPVKQLLREKRETQITSSSITFSNQRLKSIFNTLNTEFSARIDFKENEISGRSFTGAFKRDSLVVDRIVKEISLLNKLEVEKRDSSYIIRLKKYHP